MNNSLRTWLGQVTTGHGVMLLVPTILALLAGTMSWRTGAPLLLAGVIGLIWPETTRPQNMLPASRPEEMMAGYRANSTAAPARGQRE